MIFSNPDRRRFLRFSLAGAAIASAAGVLGGAGVAQAQKKAQTQASATGSAGAYPVIVLNSRDADLSLIDPKSHQVIGRIPTGKEPHHLYPTPDNRLVVVGNAMSDSLTFLDPATGTVMHAVSGVDDPYHLGFSPDQNFFVTCANRLDHVDVYRRVGHGDEMKLQGLARFNLAKTPSHLIFSDDSRVVYVTLQESHELVAIDLRRLVVLWRFAVGNLPAGVAISPDSKLIFVGVMGENAIDVIQVSGRNRSDPQRVTKIVTGEGAHAFRNQGNRQHLWVSNRVANSLSKVDMGSLKVEAEIKVPGGPDCMDIHESGKQLWVTQRWIRAVSVVDLDAGKVIKRITVGRSPHGVYLHDRAGLL